jgi:hypothetical protein
LLSLKARINTMLNFKTRASLTLNSLVLLANLPRVRRTVHTVNT